MNGGKAHQLARRKAEWPLLLFLIYHGENPRLSRTTVVTRTSGEITLLEIRLPRSGYFRTLPGANAAIPGP